jgi:hypothetical protein
MSTRKLSNISLKKFQSFYELRDSMSLKIPPEEEAMRSGHEVT